MIVYQSERDAVGRMSLMGHKRTLRLVSPMSALPLKADIRDISELSDPVTIRIFFSCGLGEIAQLLKVGSVGLPTCINRADSDPFTAESRVKAAAAQHRNVLSHFGGAATALHHLT